MRYRVMGMMSKCSSALYTGSKIYPQEHRKRDQAAWCSMFSLLHVSESSILSILRCLSSAKYDHLVCTTMVPPRNKPSPFGSFSGKTKLLWFRSHSTATLQTLYCHSTATLQPLYSHSTDTVLPLYCHSTATLQTLYSHSTATLQPLYCHSTAPVILPKISSSSQNWKFG